MAEIACCNDCCAALVARGARRVTELRELSLGYVCDVHIAKRLQRPYPAASNFVDATQEQIDAWAAEAPRVAREPLSDAEAAIVAQLAMPLLVGEFATEATIQAAVDTARIVYDTARGIRT